MDPRDDRNQHESGEDHADREAKRQRPAQGANQQTEITRCRGVPGRVPDEKIGGVPPTEGVQAPKGKSQVI